MQQSVTQITAGCNKQNVVFNNGLLELQLAVMLQFCNITAGCYFKQWQTMANNILITISMLDQNQRYDTYTYHVFSAD